jgi:hypothetical protein
MERLLDFADSAKFGAGVTVTLIVVVCAKLPDVPVTVTVAAPVVAVRPAVSFKVLLVVAGLVANFALTPSGSPDAERVTLPSKPFIGVMVIVLLPDIPCSTLKVAGVADRV